MGELFRRLRRKELHLGKKAHAKSSSACWKDLLQGLSRKEFESARCKDMLQGLSRKEFKRAGLALWMYHLPQRLRRRDLQRLGRLRRKELQRLGRLRRKEQRLNTG